MAKVGNETTHRLAETVKAELKQKVADLNRMRLLDASNDDVETAIAAIGELVTECNKSIKNEAFASIRNGQWPMWAAVEMLTVKAVTARDVKTGDTSAWEIGERETLINLVEFENFCKTNIGHVAGWRYGAETVAKLISARVTKDIGGDADALLKHYRISPKAEKLDTQQAIPTSNAQLTKLLQTFCDKILWMDNGEGLNTYKITSADVNFILYCACKAGKTPRTVTMPCAATIMKFTIQILNRLITNGSYTALYKRVDEE